jgi:ElaB/YqjD/DUF883 family membrane-anchored ribosome-binding protein
MSFVPRDCAGYGDVLIDRAWARAMLKSAFEETAMGTMNPSKPFNQIAEQAAMFESKAKKGASAAKDALVDAEGGAKDFVRDLVSKIHPEELANKSRDAYDRVLTQYRDNPSLALGTAAGVGLATGVVFGSKIGRAALLVAIGFGASYLFDRQRNATKSSKAHES